MKSTISGGKAIARRFRAVTPGLAPALNEASRKALRPMLLAARENVPVDEGDLRKALAVKRQRSARDRPTHAVGPSTAYTGRDGDRPVRYAHLVEFGRPAGADGKGEQDATRFLTRAFDATSSAALRIFGQAIGPAILRRVKR